MKYSKTQTTTTTPFPGITIIWYNELFHGFPIDWVVVSYENASYPKKTNKGFYELLYVLEGYLTIELPDQIISLEVGDMFIIQPDIEHLSKADYAKLFVVCNPPFHPDNLIFS